jgi:sirohydrochlorin cobaltochelatase
MNNTAQPPLQTLHNTQPGTGLLLFAHGARDPNWALPFNAVARQCRLALGEAADAADTASSSRVQLAFLEFMAPDLPEAAQLLAASGCSRVVVVPLFLGAGGHVRKDLPRLMAQIQQAHPQLQLYLAPAVGEAPALVAAMASVALAATQAASAATATEASAPMHHPVPPV